MSTSTDTEAGQPTARGSMLSAVDVIDRQTEYRVTLARIRRRAALIDPATLPLAWRRQLEALDPEALAAKIVRRRALRGDG